MAYFIQTKLTIKYGCLPKLTEAMTIMVPFLRTQGWTLTGAFYAIVGNFNQVTHLWEIENLDCIPTAMASTQSAPHIAELVGRFAEYVVEEDLQLVTKTDYSP